MKFDFGTDEELAQQARHKLETWKQAFRLDKKLQYKLDRGPDATVTVEPANDGDTSEGELPAAKASSSEKSSAKAKPKAKGKGKAKTGKSGESDAHDAAAAVSSSVPVSLLVRLYFSSHEKLSEQRWFDRIPTEEPFKSASPKVIKAGDPEFEESVQHFSDLE